MYGGYAAYLHGELKLWGRRVQSNVEYWGNSPHMLEASVRRSFDMRHEMCNKLRGEIGVAKKTFENTTWKGFVNVSLTAEQKEAYAAWDINDADVWDGLATYGETGYKFSLTYNRTNASWVATYTGQDGSGKNEGYAVTGFAKDPYNAARVLLFKVSAILPDVWKDHTPLPSDEIG